MSAIVSVTKRGSLPRDSYAGQSPYVPCKPVWAMTDPERQPKLDKDSVEFQRSENRAERWVGGTAGRSVGSARVTITISPKTTEPQTVVGVCV